jgi:hypothetical protein
MITQIGDLYPHSLQLVSIQPLTGQLPSIGWQVLFAAIMLLENM